jgi:hypothetical protein
VTLYLSLVVEDTLEDTRVKEAHKRSRHPPHS